MIFLHKGKQGLGYKAEGRRQKAKRRTLDTERMTLKVRCKLSTFQLINQSTPQLIPLRAIPFATKALRHEEARRNYEFLKCIDY